ncbi:beta-galactosidase [Streptomyces solaniscabiei]|uniref:beta-galactosidase n=1 Tax=Streptomyces solaniscabiei TaxID=2683255 RepID=UPI001CE26E08|nr:beta-galactosidase [Streptomyces solaniscabiei]
MSQHAMDSFRTRLPGIVYGGDYNPEQWPQKVWKEDVRLMREANVRLVSLGVFSWSALEPTDGTFDFAWLDEVMDLLADNGIAVAMATPNATPPPWMATDFPQSLLVNRDGVRMGVGSRGHFCPSSPVYRDRSLRIARALAERYGSHPALAMWHIGNEYHAECFCDLCGQSFRRWLQNRYQTLEELNDRWGTLVWGQRYSNWSQVDVPRPVRGRVNPARDLDYARFNSHIQMELFCTERDLMRSVTPDIPVTTNFVQFFPLIDYHRWSKEVDVVAFDCYPDPAKPTALVDAAMQYDLMRSMRGGESWLLLEQAAGAVSQWAVNLVKQPNMMRLGSYQAIAHGADAVMFFQWRAARYGQEKFHSAMLPHGGEETRSWQEVRALGNELKALDDVVTATTTAQVAIVWDWENWWAVEGCYHPLNSYRYREAVSSHYQALWKTGVAVDVVTLDDDLSSYKVLVVPNQYLISDTQRAALDAFARSGGHVLVSYFSGIVDENDRIHPNGYPGGLRDTVGGHIRELSPLPVEAAVGVRGVSGSFLGKIFRAQATAWQDDLIAETATPAAVYTQGYLAGQPAVLDHTLGDGTVVYLGTDLGQPALETIVQAVLERAAVPPAHPAPPGVEVTERHTEDTSFLFFLNHLDDTATLTLQQDGIDLLTGRTLARGQQVTLEATDVLILRSPRHA